MRSKARLKSHPIHPMLIPFPLAFFTGSFLFDIAAIVAGDATLWETAYWLQLAGILFAVIAAVPGLIDFIYTVPPKSSAKKRAAIHGSLNVIMLLIFVFAWYYRLGEDYSGTILLAMEFTGVIILSIAGWMGGTLAYRNQIGVDIRYAGSGKWKEKRLENKKGLILAADDGELSVNQMMLLHVGNRRIVLARGEVNYAAFDDHCTHRGGSLAGGSMICGTVQCPWHGSQFDIHSGVVKGGPAKESIVTYPVTIAAGKVYLNLSSQENS